MDDLNLIKPIGLFEQTFNYKLRLNNSPFDKFADFTCAKDIINCADGSSIVTVGMSRVICGIRVKVTSQVSSGSLICNIEHLGLSNRSGKLNAPTSKEAQSLSIQLQSILNSIAVPDCKDQLCIYTASNGDEKCLPCGSYLLFVDVLILHDDGCLLDACLSAALLAISSTRWPRLVGSVTDGDSRQVTSSKFEEAEEDESMKLIIRNWPVGLTFCIVPRPPNIPEEKFALPLIAQPSSQDLVLWDVDATICQIVLDSNSDIVSFLIVGGFASNLWSHLENSKVSISRNILPLLLKMSINHSLRIRQQLFDA